MRSASCSVRLTTDGGTEKQLSYFSRSTPQSANCWASWISYPRLAVYLAQVWVPESL